MILSNVSNQRINKKNTVFLTELPNDIILQGIIEGSDDIENGDRCINYINITDTISVYNERSNCKIFNTLADAQKYIYNKKPNYTKLYAAILFLVTFIALGIYEAYKPIDTSSIIIDKSEYILPDTTSVEGFPVQYPNNIHLAIYNNNDFEIYQLSAKISVYNSDKSKVWTRDVIFDFAKLINDENIHAKSFGDLCAPVPMSPGETFKIVKIIWVRGN